MVLSSTILRDTLFFIKNFLQGAINDPISNRPTGQSFIMTSYPAKAVTYPLITIKDTSSRALTQLGLQSEAQPFVIEIEVRVWANTVAQRDQLADAVYVAMKNNQIGSSGTSQANELHDFKLLNSINIDDPDNYKTKVMTFSYLFIAT